MVLGTIKRANIIDIILVPILSILNFLKGISLFARCSVFGLTIIEIPKLINTETTTKTNSVILPFLTVGYIKKGEKCLFKGVFLPFKIVVWEASYEIFFIFLLSSLG